MSKKLKSEEEPPYPAQTIGQITRYSEERYVRFNSHVDPWDEMPVREATKRLDTKVGELERELAESPSNEETVYDLAGDILNYLAFAVELGTEDSIKL